MPPERGSFQEAFLHLSALLDRKVLDRDGQALGKLSDIGCAAGDHFPKAVTYYLRSGWFTPLPLAVPAPAFESLDPGPLRLAVDASAMQPVPRRLPEEILLRAEILDKQIVDTDGARVVRVNDVHLLRARGTELHVVHVDIGYRGLLRRLGWEPAFLAAASRLGRVPDERLLSWRYVVPLRPGSLTHDLRLNVAQTQLSGLHPAELAEIMEELDRFEAPAVFQALDVPKAAQTLAELSPEIQRLLLEALDLRRASALLAAMPKDEEADLLEELPEPLRERLIAALPAAEQATVTELLAHEPDTAGSLMNPEYLSVPPASRVEEVLGLLRSRSSPRVKGYAVLVTGPDGRLLGVLHLPELAAADPARTAAEVMDADPVTAHPDDPMEEVAESFDRFNLLSVPVTDPEGQVEGIVTVDDVVAWLREGERREGGLT